MEVFWEVSMKKILSCIVILLLVASCFPAAAMAKTETVEINVGEGAENYVFQIVWENTDQEAQVEITSPDGVVYSTEETPEAVSGEGLIVFNVGAAAAGTWQVAITWVALCMVQVDGRELPGFRYLLRRTQTDLTGRRLPPSRQRRKGSGRFNWTEWTQVNISYICASHRTRESLLKNTQMAQFPGFGTMPRESSPMCGLACWMAM